MVDFRTLKVGEKLTYTVDEFDGYSQNKVVVTEVNEDHAIARLDDMNLWIDEDTEYMFSR